jgi:phosphate regulon sensor kinase PhoR
MTAVWRRELIASLLRGAVVGVPVAIITQDWRDGLLAALALLLALQLWRVQQLLRWLAAPKKVDLPATGGVWGEIYDALFELQRRNRKRKKRLAAILAEFQASTAALPDGAVVLAPRGEIAWFNDAAQVLLGLRASQDLGVRVPNLLRHPRFTAYWSQADYAGEVEFPSPVNESLTLAARIIPYGNNQRLLVVRDVSELRMLDAARRDFVANASHELRTPLTVLHGYLDLLRPESGEGGNLQEWRRPIQEMGQQVARMESLIGDLLRLARMESDVIHSRQDLVDMPALLERQLREALALSRGRHRFESEIDSTLLLFGREGELQSVVGNLLANAVNYTPDGGIVRLEWRRCADEACLTIADTGIGIAADALPRLTERFYRVDAGRSRASGGTGLGLAIVKHALELHEGRLEIESEPGVGSSFSCRFPPHRLRQGRGQNPRAEHSPV